MGIAELRKLGTGQSVLVRNRFFLASILDLLAQDIDDLDILHDGRFQVKG